MVRTSPSNARDAGSTLVGTLRSHMPHGWKTRAENNRRDIVTGSVKTVKMAHFWGVGSGGWYTGTLMACLCCCVAETNMTLQSNYPPIKNKRTKEVHIKKKKSKNNKNKVWTALITCGDRVEIYIQSLPPVPLVISWVYGNAGSIWHRALKSLW